MWKYKKHLNILGQITVGYGVSGSASFRLSKAKADYASTREQAGVYAGDDGYQINVKNNTDLKGGLITSTQTAEDMGKNSFSTGSLTHSDVHNHADYSAKGIGVGGGISMGGGEGAKEVGGVKLSEHGKNNKDGSSATSISKAMGIANDSGHDSSITYSGINTKNITITDEATQLAKTGLTAEEAIAAIYTDTTIDNAVERSGAIANNFDKDKVTKEINLQMEVMKEFDTNLQEAHAKIDELLDKNKQAFEEGKISQAEYEAKQKALKNTSLLFDTIAAFLGTPSTNVAGSVLAAASPAMAQQIGEYFKSGHGGGEGSPQHILAHTILGMVVAVNTGNNALVGGLAAGGAEAVTPVAQYLYGKEAKDLSADEKSTVSNIVSFGGAALGATTGNINDIATGSSLAQNAVDNNTFWLSKQQYDKEEILRKKDPVAYKQLQEDKLEIIEDILSYFPVTGTVVGSKNAETPEDWALVALDVVPIAKYGRKAVGIFDGIKKAISKGDVKQAEKLSQELKGVIENQRPYNSKMTKNNLENVYGKNKVSSTTLPPDNAKNVKLAGQRHPKTGIVFDSKGYPIFDDIAVHDTRINIKKFRSVSYDKQMEMATGDLAKTLQANPSLKNKFTKSQRDAIFSGKAKIPDYTWHHHQDTGRMQLIKSDIHGATGHIGWEGMKNGK